MNVCPLRQAPEWSSPPKEEYLTPRSGVRAYNSEGVKLAMTDSACVSHYSSR